jgi:NAD(P)-dependent dehydrogenase (short-subunit alcohol dehydrogenase family)
MDLGIKGEVAVIVGGANGIGWATARAFASEGASVAVVDLSADAATRAKELVEEEGVRALGVRCDITDLDAVQSARDRILAELKRVDHIVHAAAIGSGKFGFPFLNLEPADWRRVLEVNVEGAVNIAHMFSPTLIEQKRGTFAMISSVAALFGSPTDPPYSASKAALLNFAQCMARDLAPHGVRVNTICPGMVRTALNRAVWQSWHDAQPADQRLSYEDWGDEKVHDIVPLGRWQDPEDVASMAVFLASERARNVTGQTVNVDGGYVMR